MSRFGEALTVQFALGICALALFGCGGGETSTTTTAAKPATSAGRTPRKAAPSASGCHLGHLVHALDRLEGNLAVGLSYDQYFEEVDGARTAYEAVPVQSLELPCLSAVGTPAEKALDKYIEGANVWRACRADVNCGTYAIEPRLQRAWRVASHYLAEIQ